MGENGHEAVKQRRSVANDFFLSHEHTPHHYGTNSNLNDVLLTTGVSELMRSLPYLNPIIKLKQLEP